MKRLFGFFALGSILVMGSAACGGDDDSADAAVELANPGFILPPAGEFPVAYKEIGGVWTEQGPANFNCLGTASDDVISTEEIVLTGKTRDFQTDDIVDGVDLAVFALGADLGGAPSATTTSNQDGDYTLNIPADLASRWAFRSTDPEDFRFLDTYLINTYFDPAAAGHPNHTEDLNSVSFLTANALPAFIGVMRTEGLGVLAGAFRDCDDNEVDGIIATVNAESCLGGGCDVENLMHLDGAQTYYFSAGSTSLPVRLSQASSTNHDGLFVVIELPPNANSYLQAWGYATQADADSQTLTLIGEVPSPVLADSIITGSMEPVRD